MNGMILFLEILGTIAFSLSGAIEAMKKKMDILGVMVLGVVTAVGGGILRDIIIGLSMLKTGQYQELDIGELLFHTSSANVVILI